jgi:hypothetical protein
MTYKPKPTGTVRPFCECGECFIDIYDANSGDYEAVPSGQESTQKFVEIEVVLDGCEVLKLVGRRTGVKWVEVA